MNRRHPTVFWIAVLLTAGLATGCSTAGTAAETSAPAHPSGPSGRRPPGFSAVQMAPDGAGFALFNRGPYEYVLRTRTNGENWTSVTPSGASPRGGITAVLGPRMWAAAVFLPYEFQKNALLFITKNGGLNWTPSVLPGSFPTSALQPLAFVAPPGGTPRMGFALLSSHLVRTVDGGADWSAAGPSYGARRGGALPALPRDAGISFSDARTGWITGGSEKAPLLYETVDGGTHWRRVPLPAVAAMGRPVTLPLRVWPGGAMTVGAKFDRSSGAYYVAFQSADAGRTWKPSRPVPCAPASPASWISPLAGWVAGRTQDGSPTLLRTQNGGLSYTLIRPRGFQPRGRLTDLDFATDSSGFAIELTPKGSFLYRTNDGGLTWKAVAPPVRI